MKTFTANDYRAIQVANIYGLDKESWIDRLLFVEENREQLLNMDVSDPLWIPAVKNYLEERDDGMVQLDATASGLQILGAISLDPLPVLWTNLTPMDQRFDIYSELYEEIDPEGKLNRKDVKKAVMTAYYGSEDTPKKLFSKRTLNRFYQVLEEKCPLAWKINTALVKGWNRFRTENEWTLPDGFEVSVPVYRTDKEMFEWEGTRYIFNVTRQGCNDYGKSLGANLVHSLDAFVNREVIRRCWYTQDFPNHQDDVSMVPIDTLKRIHKAWEVTGFLSARVLTYIHQYGFRCLNQCEDEFSKEVYELIQGLPEESMDVVSIHDCYGVKSKYGNQIRKIYNQVMYELARSNTGEWLIQQVLGDVPLLDQISENKENNWTLIEPIKDAEYALS